MHPSQKIYFPKLSERTVMQKSTLFPDRKKTVRFIVCRNAYEIAVLAKQYVHHSVFHGKLMIDLAKSILFNDTDVTKHLPKTFIDDITEWIWFFQQNDIPEEMRNMSIMGSCIAYRIVSSEILNDNIYKSFVPFTNMYRLTKYESEIETMMKEITEAVYGVKIYVSILLPTTSKDVLTEEDVIAREILGLSTLQYDEMNVYESTRK
jgi:hypothetical protein